MAVRQANWCECSGRKSRSDPQKLARRGRAASGWFYGFKLHMVINHRG